MFTNLFYFPFLAIAALIYWLLPRRKLRTAFLILCSYGFIGYFDPYALMVTIGLTFYVHLMAIWLVKTNRSKRVHRLSVLGLTAILAAFKYLGFLTGTFNHLLSFIDALPQFRIESLLLPLGISYLVFKCISYLTDVYWNITERGNLFNTALYCSLFTIFVAGPIERFERLKPQLEADAEKFDAQHLSYGFERIVTGLFKKLVLADWIGYFINPVFQNQGSFSSAIRVIALFGYSLQIYFDFAGYSDIAIGSSRLFGLRIMENFNNPYLAPNIGQFWRRWHISLSDWIRDYVFFPLSQGKSSRFWLIFCVPVIAMAACGLWHGAAWRFVIWGVWHGLGLSVFQQWNQVKRRNKAISGLAKTRVFYYASIMLTFAYVTAGWFWFR